MSDNAENKKKRKFLTLLLTIALLVTGVAAIILYLNEDKGEIKVFNKKSPKRIGQVTLTVNDLDMMTSFYKEIIGFEIMERNESETVLTTDGETPLLVLKEESEAEVTPSSSTGVEHFAILLPDRESLGKYMVYLNQKGYLEEAADLQHSESIYFTDPEWNKVEVYVDNPPETWETNSQGLYVGGDNLLDVEGILSEIEEEAEEFTGLPEEAELGHIHLVASDVEEMKKFYVEVLGFDVSKKSEDQLFVSKDRYHHYIGIDILSEEQLSTDDYGISEYNLFLESSEIRKVKRQLKKNDINFTERDKIIKVKDPAGNNIIINIL